MSSAVVISIALSINFFTNSVIRPIVKIALFALSVLKYFAVWISPINFILIFMFGLLIFQLNVSYTLVIIIKMLSNRAIQTVSFIIFKWALFLIFAVSLGASSIWIQKLEWAVSIDANIPSDFQFGCWDQE